MDNFSGATSFAQSSFNTTSGESSMLSSTLADLGPNNASGDTNQQSRPTVTTAQLELVKKAIRLYFMSAPLADSNAMLLAQVRHRQYLEVPEIGSLIIIPNRTSICGKFGGRSTQEASQSFLPDKSDKEMPVTTNLRALPIPIKLTG